MKIIYLLPPSEGKNPGWFYEKEILSFDFEKPNSIAKNATEKDLKCSWKRFFEATDLNKEIWKTGYFSAMDRYSWVMFKNISYFDFTPLEKKYFDDNFLIFSGYYWLLKPTDIIWDYKLPIESKWLYKFWGHKISNALYHEKADLIINLLPNSYWKLLIPDEIYTKVVDVNFLTEKDWKIVKISHWVKKIKWEFIKKICKKRFDKLEDFWWEIIEKNWKISINLYYL